MAGGMVSAENAKFSESKVESVLPLLWGKKETPFNMHQAAVAATLAEVVEEGAAAATAVAAASAAATAGAVSAKSHSAHQDHCHPRGKGALLPLADSLLIGNTYKKEVIKISLGKQDGYKIKLLRALETNLSCWRYL